MRKYMDHKMMVPTGNKDNGGLCLSCVGCIPEVSNIRTPPNSYSVGLDPCLLYL